MKKQLLIAGGTGMIGTALQRQALANEWEVTFLSRRSGKNVITWDPEKRTIDLPEKMEFDAIVNLAGANLNNRWTESNKKEFYGSRINSSRTLENYLFDGRISTDVYLGASAIGIYGDSGQDSVNERTQVKKDNWFTALVMDWEKSHKQIAALEIRTIILRFGVVLSKEDGALKEILKSTPFGILPQFGNGSQVWSWIHIEDVASMILYCLEQKKISGTYLATAPFPVSNRKLIKSLNAHLGKLIVPVPKLMLSIMLGEMHRVVFDSCNAPPQKIMNSGYKFRYETIEEAAKALLD